MHRLPQARRAANQRHEAEATDQAGQRRNVDIASLCVDQGRLQYRPANLALLADRSDLVFGLRQPSNHLALGRDLGILLGDHAGRLKTITRVDDGLSNRESALASKLACAVQ